MKHFFIILFILVNSSTAVFSQIKKDNLLGSWIKVKTEMKDSSRLIPIYPDYVKYIQFHFLRNKLITNYYPAQNNKANSNVYQLRGNTVFITKHLRYEVEKLTKDSLVLVEHMNWLEDDKLKRFYLIKKEKLIEEEKLKNKGSSHLIANPHYTPTFKHNLALLLNRVLKKKHRNQKLKGTINISLKEKQVKVDITYRNTKDIRQEKLITNYLEQSFKSWDLKEFKSYSIITIKFAIIVEKTKTYRGLSIELLSNSFTQLLGRYGLTYEQQFDGNKYFNKGVESYKSGDYKLAMEYFTKSFELNHTKVDALYNRAASYLELKQYNKACTDWKTLLKLGQKRGERLYLQYCN